MEVYATKLQSAYKTNAMKTITLFACIIISLATKAQQPFFQTVKVEYEKTTYVHQLIKEIDPEWFEWTKDKTEPIQLRYFDLIADSGQSLFRPGREVNKTRRGAFDLADTKNTVYTNFSSGLSTSQKPVFEETFIVEDSLSRIQWKLTADTRTIAGFECRKAIGIMNDTIGVFAFYADELMMPAGPESVHGLPGLILGLSIPRLHTTWFATKVEVNGVNMSQVKAPAGKGKKVTKATLQQQLQRVLKNWGKEGEKMVINFII